MSVIGDRAVIRWQKSTFVGSGAIQDGDFAFGPWVYVTHVYHTISPMR